MLEKLNRDAGFAADALHVVLRQRLPGESEAPQPKDREVFEELEYAGELLLVQFFALVRSALTAKPQ